MIKGVIKINTIGDKYNTPGEFWDFVTNLFDTHLEDVEILEIQVKDK